MNPLATRMLAMPQKYSKVVDGPNEVDDENDQDEDYSSSSDDDGHDPFGEAVELDEIWSEPTSLQQALLELKAARAQIAILSSAGASRNRAAKPKTQGQAQDYSAGGEEGGLEAYFATPIWRLLKARLPWLVGLLLLQSCSALILASADALLQKHLVIAYFVPMVVGTGGNAGNQPGVMVTRALSEARKGPLPMGKLLWKESSAGVITALIVATVAFLRVLVEFPEDPRSAFALGLAMFFVVFIAIILGVYFSWQIHRFGLDPAAGSAPLLTTISDLIGIGLLTVVGYAILGV